jgi:magnesium-transporting ATPase (P-type)
MKRINVEQLNRVFQLTQALQLTLLTAQGVILIFTKNPVFNKYLWIGLLLLSLLQLLLIFYYPSEMKTTQLINRMAMMKLRGMAILPYVLIVIGLFIVRKT